MHDIRLFIPELFSEPGSLLYIDCRVDAHSWLEELVKAGHTITILEIWQENIGELNEYFKKIENFKYIRLIGGDVRNIQSYPGISIYDEGIFNYIFWWHGPEHLEKEEIFVTIKELEKRTNSLIALACPYGIYPQGVYRSNPYELHKSTLYPEFFELLGYETKVDGIQDQAGSEIVACKRMR